MGDVVDARDGAGRQARAADLNERIAAQRERISSQRERAKREVGRLGQVAGTLFARAATRYVYDRTVVARHGFAMPALMPSSPPVIPDPARTVTADQKKKMADDLRRRSGLPPRDWKRDLSVMLLAFVLTLGLGIVLFGYVLARW